MSKLFIGRAEPDYCYFGKYIMISNRANNISKDDILYHYDPYSMSKYIIDKEINRGSGKITAKFKVLAVQNHVIVLKKIKNLNLYLRYFRSYRTNGAIKNYAGLQQVVRYYDKKGVKYARHT